MRQKKGKKKKHAQLGDRVEFALASALHLLPDADHLSPGSFDPREDRIGAFRKLFETRVRVVQEDPGGCSSFVMGRELGTRTRGELSGVSLGWAAGIEQMSPDGRCG